MGRVASASVRDELSPKWRIAYIQVKHHNHGGSYISNYSRGRNILTEWAKIVDCGDAPLTVLVQLMSLWHLQERSRLTL